MKNKAMRVVILVLSILALLLGACSGGGGSSPQAAINAQKVGAQALPNSTPFPVTTASDDQSAPASAYNTNDNQYLVVWTDNRDQETRGTDIYGAIVVPGSSLQPTAFRITSTVDNAWNQSQPSVAFDTRTLRYLVVWTDMRNGYGQIYGQLLDRNGTLLARNGAFAEDNFAVSYHGTITRQGIGTTYQATYLNQQTPKIIYNDIQEKFMVVWVDQTLEDYTKAYAFRACGFYVTDLSYVGLDVPDDIMVVYTTVSSNGVVDVTQTISDSYITIETSKGDCKAPEFTIEDDGTCTVTKGTATLSEELVVRVILRERTPDVSFAPHDGNPLFAYASSENVLNWKIDFKSDIGGDCFTGEEWLAGPSISETWGAGDESVQAIEVRKKDRTGFTQWRRTSVAGHTDAMNPSMSMDKYNNRMLLAWESSDTYNEGGLKDIFGMLFDLDGFVWYGSLIEVSDFHIGSNEGIRAPYDQAKPKVAFDTANQRYMIVWEDARNTYSNLSNMDIYGRFIDPQGQLSGGAFPVASSTSNQIQPSVTFGDDEFRKFLITWKDGRNATTPTSAGDSDIYGTYWEFSTAPQLLITDLTDTPLYTQTMDFGSAQINDPRSAVVKNFRIWNNGNAPLTITSIVGGLNVATSTDTSKAFNLLTNVPQSINPGFYYDMSVRFMPSTVETFSGDASSLTINSNGGAVTLYFSAFGYDNTTASDLRITTTGLGNGEVDKDYTATVHASGGRSPYTWEIKNGVLPDGLDLATNSGVISGSPSAAGVYTFTLMVTDSSDTNDDGVDENKTATTILSINVEEAGGNSQACYIATAAYGSYLDSHVKALRQFRDKYLLTNPVGQVFVKTYYRLSPPAADFIAKHETLRTATRFALTPIVYTVEFPLLALGYAFAGCGAFALWREGRVGRRRRNS